MTRSRDLADSADKDITGTLTVDAAIVQGDITVTGTVDGIDVAARDAVLTSTTTTAGAALPKAGGAMTGAITTNSTFDGVDIATRDAVLTSTTTTANAALPKAGGALTGAVTTNSTFDGRDVAADGVTADAALPKAGGAMTGPITTNSTFDGVDVGVRDSVLTSTTTTANAALPKAGGALTGNVTLGDNNKAIFGAGSDLQIFHDGSNSYITDAGDGDLILTSSTAHRVRTNQFQINNNANNEEMISAVADGAVAIRYNGSKKLETTNTGVDVTGTMAADVLDITEGTNARLITSDGIGEVGSGNFALQITNAAGSALKPLGFRAEDIRFATGAAERVRIDGSGNVDLLTGGANLKLYYNAAGQYSTNLGWRHLQLGNNGANYIVAGNTSTGGDLSFVVNNTTDLSTNNGSSHNGTEAIHINSGGNVGIGTNTPDHRLDVTHNVSSEYVATFQNTANNLELKIGTTTGGYLNVQGSNATNGNPYNFSLNADGGYVGINTTTPAAPLQVDSDNGFPGIILSRDGGVSGRRPFGIGMGGATDATMFINASNDTTGAGAFGASRVVVMELEAAGDVRIKTGNLVIGTAGKGISFAATGGGTDTGGTDETLSDFETGTWTPKLTDVSGNEASGYTSGYPKGTYTKIGRHVWVNFSIRITNKGSMAGGYVFVANLPFNKDVTAEGRGTGTIDYYSGFAANKSYLALDCSSTVSVLWLVGGTNQTGSHYVTPANLGSSSMFKGGANYIAT